VVLAHSVSGSIPLCDSSWMVHSSVKMTSLNWRSFAWTLSSHHFNHFSLFVSVIRAQYLVLFQAQPSSLLALLTELRDVLTAGNYSSSFQWSCLEVTSLFSAMQLSRYLYCLLLRDLLVFPVSNTGIS